VIRAEPFLASDTLRTSCTFVALTPVTWGLPRRVKTWRKVVSQLAGDLAEPMLRSRRSVRVRPRVENVRVEPGVLHLPLVDWEKD
jgi:hypothetical protein